MKQIEKIIIKAESLCLIHSVNEINSRAGVYISDFFKDKTVSAELYTFSKTKSTKEIKPSLNIRVWCDNNDVKIDSLSGGEKSRIVIAFNMALCDVQESPLILLDEVTANLDQELAVGILKSIHKVNPKRTVIVVAHQCVTGIFKNVINIEK